MCDSFFQSHAVVIMIRAHLLLNVYILFVLNIDHPIMKVQVRTALSEHLQKCASSNHNMYIGRFSKSQTPCALSKSCSYRFIYLAAIVVSARLTVNMLKFAPK